MKYILKIHKNNKFYRYNLPFKILAKLLSVILSLFNINSYVIKKYKYTIQQKLNYSEQNDSGFIGYILETYGDTYKELLNNVVVEAINQNGENVNILTLEDDDLDLQLHNEIVLLIQKKVGFK